MQVKSLGLQTELLFTRFAGKIEDRGDYLVIRTPANPNYWFGNYVLFPAPPGAGDLARWMTVFAKEFGTAETAHRVFCWDSANGDEGAAAEFVAAGFKVQTTDVLAATSLDATPTPIDELEVRALESDDDWKQHLAITLLVGAQDDGMDSPEHTAFVKRSQEIYRELVAAGRGNWWGAFRGRRLLADLGLFFEGSLGRFQFVKTHPDVRRQGLCRHLVTTIAGEALRSEAGRTLVIHADADSPAGRIYRSVGFEARERLVDLHRRPTDY